MRSEPHTKGVAEELAGKGFTVRQLLEFYMAKIPDGSITTNDVVRLGCSWSISDFECNGFIDEPKID